MSSGTPALFGMRLCGWQRHSLLPCKTIRDGMKETMTLELMKETISQDGMVEKKGEAHCRELVSGLPLERLLLETDGPYMLELRNGEPCLSPGITP